MSDILALFRVFVRTVEAGSFSAVARELHSSQPTVSRQIAVLEDHLGCRLFQRTTRQLSPTEDGRLFYDRARRALDAVAEAEGAVGRRKGTPVGLLRLACSGVFGRLHVIPRLAGFRARYPEVDISLQMSDGFVDLVEEGVDLAIRVGDVRDESLIAKRVAVTRRVAVASPGYLRRRGVPAHPAELAHHECIVYERLLTGATWTFVSDRGPFTVEVSGPIRVNNTEAVRAAVLEGLGVGYVPLWHFTDGEIEDGRLEVLLKDFEPPLEPISVVYPSRRFLSLKVRAAIDYFEAEFARDPKLQGDAVARTLA